MKSQVLGFCFWGFFFHYNFLKQGNIWFNSFDEAEINHGLYNDDRNKSECAHVIGIINHKVHATENRNSFLKNEHFIKYNYDIVVL